MTFNAIFYTCDKCGHTFYDKSHNPYTDDTDHLLAEGIRQQAILHALETGHETYTIDETDLKMKVKSDLKY